MIGRRDVGQSIIGMILELNLCLVSLLLVSSYFIYFYSGIILLFWINIGQLRWSWTQVVWVLELACLRIIWVSYHCFQLVSPQSSLQVALIFLSLCINSLSVKKRAAIDNNHDGKLAIDILHGEVPCIIGWGLSDYVISVGF